MKQKLSSDFRRVQIIGTRVKDIAGPGYNGRPESSPFLSSTCINLHNDCRTGELLWHALAHNTHWQWTS